MAKRGPKPRKAATTPKGPKPAASKAGRGAARTYEHTEEKLLLRPDVGVQAQFRQRRPPRTYRYDPSLDPALSWDEGPAQERGEALIARIAQAGTLKEAQAAAAELRRMSREAGDELEEANSKRWTANDGLPKSSWTPTDVAGSRRGMNDNGNA